MTEQTNKYGQHDYDPNSLSPPKSDIFAPKGTIQVFPVVLIIFLMSFSWLLAVEKKGQ